MGKLKCLKVVSGSGVKCLNFEVLYICFYVPYSVRNPAYIALIDWFDNENIFTSFNFVPLDLR